MQTNNQSGTCLMNVLNLLQIQKCLLTDVIKETKHGLDLWSKSIGINQNVLNYRVSKEKLRTTNSQ